MPTRDGIEAHTFALLGDLEDLSEALMEMASAGESGIRGEECLIGT